MLNEKDEMIVKEKDKSQTRKGLFELPSSFIKGLIRGKQDFDSLSVFLVCLSECFVGLFNRKREREKKGEKENKEVV